MHDGILRMCEQWRNIKEIQGLVANGQVWKDFLYVKGRAFLDFPNNLALMRLIRSI